MLWSVNTCQNKVSADQVSAGSGLELFEIESRINYHFCVFGNWMGPRCCKGPRPHDLSHNWHDNLWSSHNWTVTLETFNFTRRLLTVAVKNEFFPSYLRGIFWHSAPWIKNCKMSSAGEAPLSRFKASSTILEKIKTESLCPPGVFTFLGKSMQCKVPWDSPNKQNAQSFAQTNCRRIQSFQISSYCPFVLTALIPCCPMAVSWACHKHSNQCWPASLKWLLSLNCTLQFTSRLINIFRLPKINDK